MLFNRPNRERGLEAEACAERFLTQQGLKLVRRNYRCRGGEIDLIMQDKALVVFVEVRYRKHNRFGSAKESVDLRKQQRIIATAAHYLQKYHRDTLPACRFDVLALDGGKATDIEWIKDAFQVA